MSAPVTASATAVAKVAKPDMRRLFYNKSKYALVGAFITSIASGLAFKVFYCDAKKKKYAEFYAHYDIEKENARLKKCGVFRSIPNDP